MKIWLGVLGVCISLISSKSLGVDKCVRLKEDFFKNQVSVHYLNAYFKISTEDGRTCHLEGKRLSHLFACQSLTVLPTGKYACLTPEGFKIILDENGDLLQGQVLFSAKNGSRLLDQPLRWNSQNYPILKVGFPRISISFPETQETIGVTKDNTRNFYQVQFVKTDANYKCKELRIFKSKVVCDENIIFEY
ncbi:MAG: hypothetical protein ACOYOK_09230 [Pseudobdellovibrionaceae bacterium]